MIRKLFLLSAIAGLILVNQSFGQSNAPGTLQLGLGYGGTLGGAALDYTYSYPGVTIPPSNQSGIGVNGNYGIRAQYGLADRFSAGIFIRREGAAYVATDDNGNSTTMTTSGTAFGLEGKFYAVNKDKFALYFGPSIGFSAVSTTLSGNAADLTGKASGINYSIFGGLNWFWVPFLGMSFDFGFSGSSLSGNSSDPGTGGIVNPNTQFPVAGTVTSTIKNAGIYIGVGLITKFDVGGNGGGHSRRRR